MRTPEDLVLSLEPHQIDEALRRSGLFGNVIPGVKYLHEEMRAKGWSLSDAMEAFEWIQGTEQLLAMRPEPYNEIGGEG